MDDIDLSDRKTQIVIAGGIVVAGVLVISSFRKPSTRVDSPESGNAPRTVIDTGGAFGTRADVQGQQGVWGWVGNDGSGGGGGTSTTPDETAPSMTVDIVPNMVKVGESFTVKIGGVKMNDPIEVYAENTTGRPLATATGGFTGSTSVSIKATDAMIGSTNLVVQNTMNRAVASSVLTVRPADKPTEPDKPTKPTEPDKPSSGNTTKYGRTKVDSAGKGYSCPAYATMVQEPGSNNHVCERNDDGRLFPVEKSGAGGVIAPQPEPPKPSSGTTKHGRTKVNASGKPYSCPSYATMVQEPGSTNHVCERNDDGRLFPVEYRRGGEEPEPRAMLTGVSPMPERITPAELTIRSGESLHDFSIRAYGNEDGLVKLGRLNDLSNVHAGDKMRLK